MFQVVRNKKLDMLQVWDFFASESGFFRDFPLQIENNSAGPSLKEA